MGASWVRQKGGRQQRRPLVRESDIQRTCSQLLELDGWRVLITDPCSDRSRAKGFGEKGMADALYMRYLNSDNPNLPVWGTNRKMYDPLAQVLWVEWKRPDGRVAANQLAWHARERAAGALTWIAGVDFPASIEGFWSSYKSSGLLVKHIDLGVVLNAR